MNECLDGTAITGVGRGIERETALRAAAERAKALVNHLVSRAEGFATHDMPAPHGDVYALQNSPLLSAGSRSMRYLPDHAPGDSRASETAPRGHTARDNRY